MKQRIQRLFCGLTVAFLLLTAIPVPAMNAHAYTEQPVTKSNYPDLEADGTVYVVAPKVEVTAKELSEAGSNGLTIPYHVYVYFPVDTFNDAMFTLSFPANSGITAKSAAAGSYLSASMSPTVTTDNAKGTVSLALKSAKNCKRNSEIIELMTVQMQLAPTIQTNKSYTMSVNVNRLINSNGDVLTYMRLPGSLSITGNSGPVNQTATVSFNANGGSGSMNAVTVNAGSSYTLPACGFTAPNGKHFAAWLVNGTRYAAGQSVTVSGNTTVQAIWEANTCTVSFNANGGSGSMNAVTVNAGSSYTLPACGFTAPRSMCFSAWLVNGTQYPAGATITVNDNTTVKAIWEDLVVLIDVIISFDANGGSGSMNAVTVNAGSSYTLPACGFTAPNGKHFAAWSVNGTRYAAGQLITVSGNTTVKAIWEADVLNDARGDVDMDGDIDADDAQKALIAALNYLSSGKTGLNPQAELAADVNRDGIIKAEDAQFILLYYLEHLANRNTSWETIINASKG